MNWVNSKYSTLNLIYSLPIIERHFEHSNYKLHIDLRHIIQNTAGIISHGNVGIAWKMRVSQVMKTKERRL